mgnify:CR=1 FL=1
MREYLLGLFALSLLCAAVEWLAPSGEGGGITGHIRLMGALCLLCTLIQPLLWLAREWETLPSRVGAWFDEVQGEGTSGADEEYWTRRYREESESWSVAWAEEEIAAMLCEKFSLARGDCTVTVTLGEGGGTLCEVRVALSGRAIWCDTHAMEAWVRETFGCDAVTYIK